ncbi:MAG TPA: AraC family transcriptional regulator [Rhodanobacteraceae bacterium]|nr:AraC family transcriptional regulator [Rhodanobacteraceae bacterium]
MNPEGAYGTSLADAFRLDHAPAITTRALRKSRLAVTEVRCDHEHFGMTSPIAREDAWLIALQMRPCEKHELWSDNRPAAVTPIVGGETMIYDLRRDPVAHIDSAFHSLHFYVPKSALDWIADDFGAPRIDELDCTVGRRIDDPVVRSLAGAMLPALSHPEAVNAAFAEHVLIAIAAHVAGTYGHMRLARRVVRGGLAAWQERRAKEMLTANLAADVSLSDLALECGLSVSHFARAFRQATGLPPHRWLLRHRIERSQELLRDRSRSLSEVALACGFADQSHFTRVFSGATGVSPGMWRRSLPN